VEESCAVTAHGTTTLRATCTPNTTYILGLDKARSAITLTGVGTGRPVDHTVFGGLPAIQIVPAGIDADVITVHVYY
jgi:spore coat protein U-like protein